MIPNIAVLITSHNRKQKTLECLSNLYNQTGFNTQFSLFVYLVDDGSSDGTGVAVRQQFPLVNVILGTGDLYWNRGMHLAWKTAVKSKQNFDHFLWLNDDVILYEDGLKHLLECSKFSNYESIICGVFEETKNTGIISYGGGNLIGKTYLENKLNTETLQACDILNGNCVLIPDNVYKVVGLIDPIFPHALGDHDYGLRAKKRNRMSYTTKKIIGSCKRNILPPKWCLPEVSLLKRLRSLYSPIGNSHPYYYTIFYVYRHFGLLKATKNLITIHLRVLFPSLWQ